MSKMLRVVLVLFVGVGGAAIAQEQDQQAGEPRPMTVDDALDMVNVGGALMSPDGEWVFFSKS